MKLLLSRFLGTADRVTRGQQGLSGLETTVILIAFVTLGAIFGYSVLTTGILTSERTQEEAVQGLTQVTATLNLRGVVRGVPNANMTAVDSIIFEASIISQGSDGVFIHPDSTVVSYIDAGQIVHLEPTDWMVEWLIGSGNVLGPGELIQVTVDLTSLNPPLGPSKDYPLEFLPDQGVGLVILKRTPAEISPNLDMP